VNKRHWNEYKVQAAETPYTLLPDTRPVPQGYRHHGSALFNCFVTPPCSLLHPHTPYHSDLKLTQVDSEIENVFILTVIKLR